MLRRESEYVVREDERERERTPAQSTCTDMDLLRRYFCCVHMYIPVTIPHCS